MEFYFCEPCGNSFNGIRPYNDHLASARHKKKMNQQQPPPLAVADSNRSTPGSSHQFSDPFIVERGRNFWCSICKLELNGLDQVQSHTRGSKHLKQKLHQPTNSKNEAEFPKIDLSNIKLDSSPKDIADSYSDLKFSFFGVTIENVLEDVKVYGVNDPIVF